MTEARTRSDRPDLPRPQGQRIVALDLARFLAIAGMMTEHLLAGQAPAGVLIAVTGFPSALFAVLGGVSAVISTRRYRAEDRPAAAAASVAMRGLVIAVIGFLLGFVSFLIAVVLLYYGVAMILLAALMRLRTATVLVIAGGLLVVSPHLILWAGALRPDTIGELSFSGPLGFVTSVLLTGQYPAITWLTYMLIGLCVGRMITGDPSRRRTGTIAVSGAVAAATGFLLDLATRAAVIDALRGAGRPPAEAVDLVTGLGGPDSRGHGPVGEGWIAVVNAAPHSGTTTDVLRTGGMAVLLIGVLLLLTRSWNERIPLAFRPMAGAGAAPLTIYTLHVLAASASLAATALFDPHNPSPWWMFGPVAVLAHILAALVLGTIITIRRRKGPLERVVSGMARRAARWTGNR